MNESSGPAAADIPTFEELAADPEIAALLEFAPVPLRKKANGWDPDAQRAFVALLAMTGSKLHAAEAIGRNPAGMDSLLKRRPDAAAGLKAAIDAALALAERRSSREVAQAVADAAAHRARATAEFRFAGAADEAATQRRHAVPGIPADLQERDYREALDSERRAALRWDESTRRVRDKFFMCRRMYLMTIADDPERRAAWELLCGPADWDAARELKAQPDEDREPVSLAELETASWQVPLKTGYCVSITDAGRELAASTLQRLEQSIRRNDPRFSNSSLSRSDGEGDHPEDGGGAEGEE